MGFSTVGTSTGLATQGLTTQRNELFKQYNIYDVNNRLVTVYTAGYNAITGTGCTRVDYTYINPTSPQVEKMRESNDVWDASYDI